MADPTSEQNWMPIRAFREEGYLQELNRTFLHPLGLALAVSEDEDGEVSLFGILDARDDPEGYLFADGMIDVGKANRIWTELHRRARYRFRALGFSIQPAR